MRVSIIVNKLNKKTMNQQDFLNAAMTTLGLQQKDMAERMNAPWETFRKWTFRVDSPGAREMPPIAWQLIREILAHEELRKKKKKTKTTSKLPNLP